MVDILDGTGQLAWTWPSLLTVRAEQSQTPGRTSRRHKFSDPDLCHLLKLVELSVLCEHCAQRKLLASHRRTPRSRRFPHQVPAFCTIFVSLRAGSTTTWWASISEGELRAVTTFTHNCKRDCHCRALQLRSGQQNKRSEEC